MLSKEKYIGQNIVGKTIAGVFHSVGNMLLVFTDGTHTTLLYGDDEPISFSTMFLRQYKKDYEKLVALGAVTQQEVDNANEFDRKLEERINHALNDIANKNAEYERLKKEHGE